ncbi:RNA-directed DNA polymerase [Mesonia mobilis]|uniref:Reverse transcriptase n=1 Tax=Mesonia mobilis TaxID=369791 RepID=A0ABQ3C3P6_9FLAO|nr:RNA-directed DNA polymerase [Mesonia mobilis]MBQ0739529.1 RNA-directed DNA polymerase [Aquimarina celericrescens]GGZ65659.1 reverse transcriptase [Mesonia mobilis]
MTDIELLKKGYFPKELPPPFNTELFASKLTDIHKDWKKVTLSIERKTKPERQSFKDKFRESKWVVHSIPKTGFSRRLLGIPNPYHQSILSKTIADKWKDIELIYSKSNMSSSIPIIDTTGKRALQYKNSFGEFKKGCIINSFDKLFEVKTDVSRYYGTLYTHVIPWAIHSKAVAKTKRRDLTLLGNILDKNLRESNSGQTFGIPIGPDTSLVIAEIIGCTLDKIIQDKFKSSSIKGFRFVDDYFIYCENQSDSEKVFKFIQSLFTEYQLDINEEKTKISKSPYELEANWAIELGSFTFRKHPKSQQTDIERFVSLAFRHAKSNPKDSVLNFAISVLKFQTFLDESWELFQALILKIALTEPVTLPVVAQLLISHKSKVDKSKIKSITEIIIKEHSAKGHNFEVAWALWICKEFQIKLKDKIAEIIFNSNDIISILIALDLKNIGKINASVSTKNIELELTEESLMDDKWLLTYEAITKGWLPKPKKNPIKLNEYFNVLEKNKIHFYDETKSLIPFPVIKSSTSKVPVKETSNYEQSKNFKKSEPTIVKMIAPITEY